MIFPVLVCCIASSPTIDEPSHLHAVRVGAFHTYSVNPPLPAIIAASWVELRHDKVVVPVLCVFCGSVFSAVVIHSRRAMITARVAAVGCLIFAALCVFRQDPDYLGYSNIAARRAPGEVAYKPAVKRK